MSLWLVVMVAAHFCRGTNDGAREEEKQINIVRPLRVFARIRILYEVADDASSSMHRANATDQISCTECV